jgi:hypothetical protein
MWSRSWVSALGDVVRARPPLTLRRTRPCGHGLASRARHSLQEDADLSRWLINKGQKTAPFRAGDDWSLSLDRMHALSACIPPRGRRSSTVCTRPSSNSASSTPSLEACRWLYNQLLAQRGDVWEQRQEPLRYYDQALSLPGLKTDLTLADRPIPAPVVARSSTAIATPV